MTRILASFGRPSGGESAEPSERGLDRVVNFSDAVVAIAITLVALPLVDIAQRLTVSDGPRRLEPGAQLLQLHGADLAAAALSFVVIGGFWREHHAEWERADRYTRTLVSLDLLWLASIVFLPVPTVLLFRSPDYDPVTLALYIGAMLVNMICSRFMQLEIAAHCGEPGLLRSSRFRLALEWIPVALMMVALVLAITVPAVGTKSLLVVLLSIPVTALLRRLRHRAAPAT